MTLDTKMIFVASVFIFSIIQLKAADVLLQPGDDCKFVGLTDNKVNYIVLKVDTTIEETIEFTIAKGSENEYVEKTFKLSLATPLTYIRFDIKAETNLKCFYTHSTAIIKYEIKQETDVIKIEEGESVGLAFVQKEVKVERSDNTKSVSLKIEVIEGADKVEAKIASVAKVEMVLKDKTDHFLRINENEFDGDLTLEVDMKESNGNVIISNFKEELLDIKNKPTCINGKSSNGKMTLEENNHRIYFNIESGTDLTIKAKVKFDTLNENKELSITTEKKSLDLLMTEFVKEITFNIDIENLKRAHICLEKNSFEYITTTDIILKSGHLGILSTSSKSDVSLQLKYVKGSQNEAKVKVITKTEKVLTVKKDEETKHILKENDIKDLKEVVIHTVGDNDQIKVAESSAKVVQSTISVLLPTLLAFIFCLN